MSPTKLLSGLATAGLLAGFAMPAHATLQFAADVGGQLFTCVDNNAACDTNPAVGTLQLANQTINGIALVGSVQTSTGTPANPGPNILNTSSFSITNTTGATVHVLAALSDTDFTAPVSSFNTAGSGTWQLAVGSRATLSWYNDPLNRQGANTPTDTPGTLIDTVTSTAIHVADSFSHNGAGPASDTAPFSMTELLDLLLTPHGELLNRGQTEIKNVSAVPEPVTLSLLGVGLLGLGLARRRR